MKLLSSIFLLITLISFQNSEKKAEIVNVKGIVVFSYFCDEENSNYSCPLKTKIIMEGKEYDFIPSRTVNNDILRSNQELISTIGEPNNYYYGDFFSNQCVLYPTKNIALNLNCDSLLSIYQKYNIWSKELFYPYINEELRTFTINSNTIFQNIKNKNIISIAFVFEGSVVKYFNVIHGKQTDYRILDQNNGMPYFDDSHGNCPFEKLERNFIVLKEVKQLTPLNIEEIEDLQFKKISKNQINIFMHE